MIMLTLGFPPSLNTYWRRTGSRFYVCERGIQYRKDTRKAAVMALGFAYEPIRGSVSLTLDAYPPDRRKRDLDNLGKAVGDSLQHARVFLDDFQVDELHIIRHVPVLGGKLVVTIEELE